MIGDSQHVFNREAPSKGQEWVLIGDGSAMQVLHIGSLNLKMHGDTDVGVHLPQVYAIDGLAINLFPLHAVQAKYPVTADSTGGHFFGEGGKPCST